MKKLALLILLFSFTFSFSTEKKPAKKTKEVVKVESNSDFSDSRVNISDLEALDFTADTIFKNVTFKSADKINFINIYDENNQQIFSAKGSIIVGDTMNISFLEKGTYYLEVIVGETIGAKQIII